MTASINRRQALGSAVASGIFTIIPRQVLGGTGHVAPSDRITIAQIGVGTQGFRELGDLVKPNQASRSSRSAIPIRRAMITSSGEKRGMSVGMPPKHPIKERVADLIPKPPTVLARHATNTGESQLQHRLLADGSDVFEIISNGVFLMSSQFRLSEQVLAQQALFQIEQHLHADRQVLVGGLGMGFTLQKTLEHTVAKVDVVEISNHVIDWNRQFFASLNKRALSDPRTHLCHQDLFAVLNQSKPATYAAIILDVDNGPSWLAHDQNARLYTDEALATWSTLLLPNGVLAVWSAQMEPEFMERLKRHFRDVEEATVPVPDPKGRPRNDYVYRGISLRERTT